ncbi:hypothetical protein ADL04_01570 [Streptomyces sp. NRRL B-3648]|nr:RICIN domain-containing protein [Streptomyces sp. NRRL B-3648]KOX11580.1 hypothetical protein ADL04_01570 [Streptomyces sp. NRRL B-3648]
MRERSSSRGHLSVVLAAAVAALAALAVMLVAGPAQAATSGALRGVGSGRCLDVPTGGQTDGSYVQVWDCSDGTNQQSTLTDADQLTVYGDKCLEVTGPKGDGGETLVFSPVTGQAGDGAPRPTLAGALPCTTPVPCARRPSPRARGEDLGASDPATGSTAGPGRREWPASGR